MRLDTHRAALRAAAKVAFSVALLGCGGATSLTADEGAEPEVTSGDGYDTTQADLRSKKRPPRVKCDAGNASCSSIASVSQKEACCEAVLKSTFPKGDDWQTRVADADGDVKACCQTIAEKVDRQIQGGWDEDAGAYTWPRTQCCSLLGWQGSLACTPWGPPTPPAMRAVA